MHASEIDAPAQIAGVFRRAARTQAGLRNPADHPAVAAETPLMRGMAPDDAIIHVGDGVGGAAGDLRAREHHRPEARHGARIGAQPGNLEAVQDRGGRAGIHRHVYLAEAGNHDQIGGAGIGPPHGVDRHQLPHGPGAGIGAPKIVARAGESLVPYDERIRRGQGQRASRADSGAQAGAPTQRPRVEAGVDLHRRRIDRRQAGVQRVADGARMEDIVVNFVCAGAAAEVHAEIRPLRGGTGNSHGRVVVRHRRKLHRFLNYKRLRGALIVIIVPHRSAGASAVIPPQHQVIAAGLDRRMMAGRVGEIDAQAVCLHAIIAACQVQIGANLQFSQRRQRGAGGIPPCDLSEGAAGDHIRRGDHPAGRHGDGTAIRLHAAQYRGGRGGQRVGGRGAGQVGIRPRGGHRGECRFAGDGAPGHARCRGSNHPAGGNGDRGAIRLHAAQHAGGGSRQRVAAAGAGSNHPAGGNCDRSPIRLHAAQHAGGGSRQRIGRRLPGQVGIGAAGRHRGKSRFAGDGAPGRCAGGNHPASGCGDRGAIRLHAAQNGGAGGGQRVGRRFPGQVSIGAAGCHRGEARLAGDGAPGWGHRLQLAAGIQHDGAAVRRRHIRQHIGARGDLVGVGARRRRRCGGDAGQGRGNQQVAGHQLLRQRGQHIAGHHLDGDDPAARRVQGKNRGHCVTGGCTFRTKVSE